MYIMAWTPLRLNDNTFIISRVSFFPDAKTKETLICLTYLGFKKTEHYVSLLTDFQKITQFVWKDEKTLKSLLEWKSLAVKHEISIL